MVCDTFLGDVSSRIEQNHYALTIVNYTNPVSEDWHYHEENHLSLILTGGNLESRKNEEINVDKGCFLKYNAGELHRNRFTEHPSKNLNIEIKDEFFEKNNLDFNDFKLEQDRYVENYLQLLKLYHEVQLNDSYSNEFIDTSIKSLFWLEKPTRPTSEWIGKLKSIVNDRWNEFISLDELAKEIGVHPVTISRSFASNSGGTLTDYMRKVKIHKAVDLLLTSRKSITEIAYTCGFSDHSHMTRLFKYYLGCRPKEISKL